ncbi:MurR/RpiR family transcriptional regulator [Pseudaeromonas sp. ZJS20]|uniref:MurR/RpiR family transcriptional regulator n=1 Tax=Pseudaeromonas aegiceratis TaxID=3153928 RepID=UPI00390C6465
MAEQLELVTQIEQAFSRLTPVGKRIASYMLANLAHLPFDTADSIARQAGTSGISVGRFLRSLGYRNLDHLKQSLREGSSLPPHPWLVTDRFDAYQHRQAQPAQQTLQQSLNLELDAIRHAYELAQGEAFARISRQLVEAEAVFILGIQSTRGIAHAFFSHLEYLRPRVFYADGQSGTYVESLNSEFTRPYVVLTDLRAYSVMTQRFCQAASRRQIPMALITDVYCPWARDYPLDLLQLKTDTNQFWDSLSPLSCLFNLLLSAVLEQRGASVEARLDANRTLQKELGQFES